ncbi:MAG: hypothetical protein WCC48_04860 [Anaeromyxobacteraceae bacterium]
MTSTFRVLPCVTALLFSGGARADAQEGAPPPPADVGSAPAATVEGPSARTWRWPRAQWWVGLFAGSSSVADSTVSGTEQGLFSPSASGARYVHFGTGRTAGIRAGIWAGDPFAWLGADVEVAQTTASSSDGFLQYTDLLLMPMIRVPILRTDAMPGGHVNLYAGALVSLPVSGEIRVDDPANGRLLSGPVEGKGFGFALGGSVSYWRLALQAEYRSVSLDLSFNDYFHDGGAAPTVKTVLVGLAYLWGR